jgi:hypothetical protein
MKNKINSWFVFITVLFAISCQDLEENPDGLLSPDAFFTTEADLQSAVTASYRTLYQMFDEINKQPWSWASDEFTSHNTGNKGSLLDFDLFRYNSNVPTNTDIINRQVWAQQFEGIYTANNVLANADKVNASEEVINKAKGEARFIRALSYFFLVRMFNKAPLITETTKVTGEEFSASNEAIYDLIIGDLIFARDHLPETPPAAESGRIDKYGAQALLALVYLQSAGYPLKRTENFALAATEAQNVIANSGHSLEPDFSKLWQGSKSDGNNEHVFFISFCGSCGEWSGLNNYRNESVAFSDDEGGWDEYYAEITFFTDFPESYRKDITFRTQIYEGLITHGGDISKTVNKDWRDARRGHPYYQKLDNRPLQERVVTDIGTDVAIIRFSEVLLIYAEAQAMANGGTPNAQAVEYVNQVRRRANKLPIDTPDPTVDVSNLEQSDFLNTVLNERAWELAAEYSRWFDLVRHEKVEEVIARRSDDPAELPLFTSPNKEEHYFFPLRLSDVTRNPNLTTVK